jgi:hypothetical protein
MASLEPQSPARDYVFVIRMWREPNGGRSELASWRGQVSHHRRRTHFVGLPMLFAVIAKALGVAYPEPGNPGGDKNRNVARRRKPPKEE